VEQQLILATVSIANSCEYCVAAHSGGLKMAGLPDAERDALRSGRRLKDDKLEALRAFVTAIVANRGWVKQPELQRFLDAGYTREQVLETLVGISMKTLSNYANHMAHTPLDAAFEAFAWQPATA
jgi:AhpD family alkylhydroperoxidase